MAKKNCGNRGSYFKNWNSVTKKWQKNPSSNTRRVRVCKPRRRRRR